MTTIAQSNTKLPSPKRKSKVVAKAKENNQKELANGTCNGKVTAPVDCPEVEVENEQPPSSNQKQLEEYAEFLNKIKTLQYALETDLITCDAKWTLFVSAAFSYRFNTVLQPFPPQYAAEQTGYDIDSLISTIRDTPKLRIVLQNLMDQIYNEPSSEVIDLLYWVLIEMREPGLRLVEGEELNSLLSSIDEKPIKVKPTHVFEVTAFTGFHSTVAFRERTPNLPLKLAFMGNKLDNYFTMLRNGFVHIAENKDILELTTDLNTSLQYSPYCAAWGASECGSIISCTAICEFGLNSEEDKITPNKNDKSCVDICLCNPQNIRIRYLVFYGRRFPRNLFTKRPFFSWISNHKYSFSLLSYMLLLVSIGIANSDSGESLKLFVSKKIEFVLGFCRKLIVKEPRS